MFFPAYLVFVFFLQHAPLISHPNIVVVGGSSFFFFEQAGTGLSPSLGRKSSVMSDRVCGCWVTLVPLLRLSAAARAVCVPEILLVCIDMVKSQVISRHRKH